MRKIGPSSNNIKLPIPIPIGISRRLSEQSEQLHLKSLFGAFGERDVNIAVYNIRTAT